MLFRKKAPKRPDHFWRKKKKIKYRAERILSGTPVFVPKKQAVSPPRQISPRAIVRIFWVFLVLCFIYFLLLSPYFKIKNISVTNNRVILAEEIINKIGPSVINKNIFLADRGIIKKTLEKEFPRIDFVSILRKFPGTIVIRIYEKPSTLVWHTGNSRYLLDAKGNLIDRVEGDLRMPEVNDLANVPVEIGQQIVTEDFIDFINQLANKFPKKTGFSIKSINVAETTFEVQVISDKGIYFLFDSTRNLDTQLNYLVQVLETAGGNVREYVDLRVESRVFYK